jgi:hypothetical protein
LRARRPLVAALALATAAVGAGCGSPATPQGPGADAGASAAEGEAGPTPDVAVHAVVDLPRSPATQGLSATAFDPDTRTLYALPDRSPELVPLVASEAFDAFTVGAPRPLAGRTEAAWDGEGLVRASDGTFTAVTVETLPLVERFDAKGNRTGAVTLPARFAAQAPGNKGLESLTLSPSGRFLFTANESALVPDGPAATHTKGTLVRILRRELGTGGDLEQAYRTEPLGAGAGPGDMGVSELLALSDDTLLVLERGFQAGYGNTVRVFRVTLGPPPGTEALASLSAATPTLAKTLLVDVGALPPGQATHPGTQPNPLLDNYEAMALGPALPDGRRLLFLTSDDNASATQVARVLVLSVRGL